MKGTYTKEYKEWLIMHDVAFTYEDLEKNKKEFRGKKPWWKIK